MQAFTLEIDCGISEILEPYGRLLLIPMFKTVLCVLWMYCMDPGVHFVSLVLTAHIVLHICMVAIWLGRLLFSQSQDFISRQVKTTTADSRVSLNGLCNVRFIYVITVIGCKTSCFKSSLLASLLYDHISKWLYLL